MLDFMFAVTHASHWHSINMNQHPGHYPLYTRMVGSDFVARVEEITPGVWFNAYVPTNGVVSTDSFARVFVDLMVCFVRAYVDDQVRRYDGGQPLF